MKKIESLTSDYKQRMNVTLDDGSIATLSFEYLENQQGWFFTLEYQGKKAGKIQLVNCPNIIREFQNTLPFGIGCSVNDGGEPFMLDDFKSGRVSVYILNREDVQEIGREFYGKIW